MRSDSKHNNVQVIHKLKIVRESVSEAVDSCPNLTVSSSFSRISEALTLLHSTPPDVVLLDVSSNSGEDAIEMIQAASHSILIVIWGLPLTEKEIIRYARLGVAGYITSEDTVAQLVDGINAAISGKLANPKIAWMLNRYIHNSTRQTGSYENVRSFAKLENESTDGTVSLTSREIDVVELIDKGLSNKEIARELKVELSTVKNHVHSILGKFRVNRRIMAAAQYRSQNSKVVSI